MNDEALRVAAEAAGILVHWRDATGRPREVAVDALRAILERLDSPTENPPPLITAEPGQPLASGSGRYRIVDDAGEAIEGHGPIEAPKQPGYHRLETDSGFTTIAVAPPRCWTLADAAQGKAWGLAVQLYGLRRDGDAGLGDFAALAALAAPAGAAGAAAVAISPVHAGFAADPNHFSPYAPSSRVMLNGLYADPRTLTDCPSTEDGLVDWRDAARRRLAQLRAAHAGLDGEQQAAFAQFRKAGGEALERHARFEALHAVHFGADSSLWDWHRWPAALQDPASPAVAAFATAHASDVDFHAFVQFAADRSLGLAQHATRAAGMKIGLIADLAVGVHPGGSDAWSQPAQLLRGLSVGAPGDILNPQGQGWGVTTFSPQGLVANGYVAFLAMLRSALRHAGGVRIDHAMGLARLWVIPDGAGPADGAYLRFPLDDLLRLVRLESARHQAIVIGEDLGTLPDGFLERLQTIGLAGMRVLWFEREGERFAPPERWSADAVAMTTTHDLPTVAGWWSGRDLAWHEKLGRELPGAAADRVRDRAALWAAFAESGAATGPAPTPEQPDSVVDAACRHIGGSACALALLPIEDALGLEEQPNLPGTIDEHPNWRRRLPATAATLLDQPRTKARLQALNTARSSA